MVRNLVITIVFMVVAACFASANMAQASNALDGNAATLWSSGGFAPQWIELDLGAPTVISGVRLLPAQYPAGQTTHVIYGGTGTNPGNVLCVASGATQDNTWIECNFPPVLVRYVRIVTTQSPSWVAWREIQVIPTPATEREIHKIGVRPGEFYDTITGASFYPRGYNYVRLNAQGQHALFTSEWDATRVDSDFDTLNRLGYNTVRVFVDSAGVSGPTPNSLDPVYIERVNALVNTASAHGLHVILVTTYAPNSYLTSNCLGSAGGGNNPFYFCQALVDAKSRYVSDLINATLSDAVLSYDIQNEQFYMLDNAPLNTIGPFTAPNGLTYNLPGDKQQLMDASLVYWINGIVSAVHTEHPTALVGVSFFSPVLAPPNWATRAYWAIVGSSADYVGLHIYPNPARPIAQDFAAFEIPAGHIKPLILDELGFFRSQYSLAAAQSAQQAAHAAACSYGIAGALGWTWNTHEQAPAFWTGDEGVAFAGGCP